MKSKYLDQFAEEEMRSLRKARLCEAMKNDCHDIHATDASYDDIMDSMDETLLASKSD